MNVPPETWLEEKPQPAFPISILLLGSVSAAAIYFSLQGDYGTAGAAALLGIALRSGYRAGATTFLGLLAGASLAMVLAMPLGMAVEQFFENRLGTHGLANRLLSVATVGATLIVVVTLAVRCGLRRLGRHRPGFQSGDRWLGLACGGIQGALLFLIMAGGVLIVEPLARDELLARPASDRSTARIVSEQVVMAAKATRESKLGPLVTTYNPFEHIGVLKRLQHGVEVLRSPETLTAVASHPAVEELSERPIVQETWQQLSADPELRDAFSSGEPITRATLASLMQNPAVLRLFDDREFVRGLTHVLGEIDPETLLSATSAR